MSRKIKKEYETLSCDVDVEEGEGTDLHVAKWFYDKEIA